MAKQECGDWLLLALRDERAGGLLWDMARDRMDITRAGRALHGFAARASVRYLTWLKSLHADDRGRVRRVIARAVKERGHFQCEYRVVLAEGGERWVSIRGRGYCDGAGRVRQLAGVLRDITSQKRLEQEVVDLRQALARVARTAALGGLSASITHELNQPLAATLCNAEAGRRLLEQPAPDLAEVRAIMADIASDNRRAGAVVSQLRGLFKKEGAVRQPLNVNSLVEEVARLMNSELVIHRVVPLLYLRSGLPEIRGDPVQLRQVLLNLIKNAVEAMAASVLDARRLQICTGMHDACALYVTVADTGPGIAPGMRERIFELFESDKPHGMGVGLAVSRAIVAAHGGELHADNAPDGGALLRFTLPVPQGGAS